MHLTHKFPLCHCFSPVSLPDIHGCCTHSPERVGLGRSPLIQKAYGSYPFVVSVQLLLTLDVGGSAGVLEHMAGSESACLGPWETTERGH